MTTSDMTDLLSRMPVPAPPPRRGRFLLGIAAAFLATALAATLIGGAIVRDSEGRTERTLQQRLELLAANRVERSEEHTSELQSLMRISSAVFCLKKKKKAKTKSTKGQTTH